MSDEKPEMTSGKEQEPAGSPQEPKDKTSQAKEKAKELASSAGEKIKSLASSPALKSVPPLTWVGLVLGALFFIGMFIDTVNIRWWIMLPLGIASFLVLWKQWKNTPEERDFELKLAFFGMIAMIAFLIIRDAWLSRSLADIYEMAKESGETIRELEELIGR